MSFMKRATNLKRLVLTLPLWIFLLIVPGKIFAQDVNVKGRVTKEDGQPVPRPSETVKGTTKGTVGDDNGNFQITAPSNGTLIITAVDFAQQEVKVNGQTSITITLVSLDKSLGEVVVVGYGSLRKEAITGSVASVNGEKLREVPAANISYALQGRVAGLEMSQTSTKPGATMQIRIRGARSLSADNNPLIVLDGIPFVGSLADINPDDIKSVDILKDASATAIYGSRGSNGVILVTTEKGGKGRKPRITYSAYVGSQSVFAKYPMMSGPQLTALRAAAAPFNVYTNGLDETNGTNTDW